MSTDVEIDKALMSATDQKLIFENYNANVSNRHRAMVRTFSEKVSAAPTRDAPTDHSTSPYIFGFIMPCIFSQLLKALNQPVLVVSLGYMPKP